MKTFILWRGFSTQLDFEEILIPKTKGSNWDETNLNAHNGKLYGSSIQ